MFLRQWPTEDFGTFMDYFQHHFSLVDNEALILYLEGKVSLIQNAIKALKEPAGITSNMFYPLSLALFGKNDFVADMEKWLLSKKRGRVWKAEPNGK